MDASATEAPLRIGLVGLGSWARRSYLPVLQERQDVSVNAVAARTEATRELARSLVGPDVQLYADYAELLANAQIDAVMIGLPFSLTVPAATAAVQARVHVFVEPPFRDDEEAGRLLELAAGSNKVFHADVELRYLPVVTAVAKLASRGQLGDLLRVRVELGNDWSSREAWEPAHSSMVFGLGTWYIDLLDAILVADPVRADVFGSYPRLPSVMEVGTASLKYPSGAVGEYAFNLRNGRGLELSLQLIGTTGEAEADLIDGTYRYRATGGDWTTGTADCSRPMHGFVGMRESVSAFIAATQGGSETRSGPTMYRRLQRTLSALRRSEHAGDSIGLDRASKPHRVTSGRYALVPDGVWDGTSESRLHGSAVVVSGELIESVVPIGELPAEMTRVELPGCTAIPGLIDAHVHYSPPMGPAFLAAGVTTVRDVGNNLEWILDQRGLNARDMARGPTIVCCGHLHDGPEAYWKRMGRANADVPTLRASIREHASAGVDAIKLYPGLDADMVAAGVDEAHRQGLPATAHLTGGGAEAAVLAGLNGIEHQSGCDVAWRDATEAEDETLIELLLNHRVYLDPTLVIFDRAGRGLDLVFKHDRRRSWAHPAHTRYWDRGTRRLGPPATRQSKQRNVTYLKRFLRHAHEAGVTVALGTDTPFPRLTAGFSVHDEVSLYVDAGISPVGALRSATSVNARVLGVESSAGRIAKRLTADILVVKGNPLEDIHDISNVETVVRKGRRLDLSELRQAVQASFGQQPDDAITNDLLDRIEPQQ